MARHAAAATAAARALRPPRPRRRDQHVGWAALRGLLRGAALGGGLSLLRAATLAEAAARAGWDAPVLMLWLGQTSLVFEASLAGCGGQSRRVEREVRALLAGMWGAAGGYAVALLAAAAGLRAASGPEPECAAALAAGVGGLLAGGRSLQGSVGRRAPARRWHVRRRAVA